jgi:hypothetical protein
MSVTNVDAMVKELDRDYAEVTPDQYVIASQIVYQGKLKNRPVPMSTLDLAFGITAIAVDHTRVGAQTLVITIADPRWNLLDSGFFTADATGKLLDIDLNYPDGKRFWWRLHQFSPTGDDYSIQLTFLPRGVAKLMGLFGPVQVDRASRTRAQFLQMLASKVPEIEFYSKELDVKQPIGAVSTTSTESSSKSKAGKAAKVKGLGAGAKNLTAKGSPLNATQQHSASLIMQTCDQEGATEAATEACMFAAIMESDLGVDTQWNTGSYGGLLAGSSNSFGRYGSPDSDAVAQAEIKSFLHGGNGYSAGGAIGVSQQGGLDVGQVAAKVEGCYVGGGSSLGPNGYGQYANESGTSPAQVIAEAKAIVQAAGGGSSTLASTGSTATTSTTSEVAQPYYFQVQQNEDYWTAMCRLAQEVNWDLVADGDRIYFDSDKVFITQKPAAKLTRNDPTTVNWSYDWVNRQIATNFKLSVVADLFDFGAAEVLLLDSSFGLAGEASTASPPLPGRWLIDEITQTKGDLYSVFTLVQPSPPLPEPAPTYTSVTVGTPASTSASTSAVKIPGSIQDYPPGSPEALYAAAQYLSSLNLTYTQAVRTLEKTYAQGETALDCSASTSWCMLAAGFPLPGGVSWGGWAPVSGDFTPGQAGLQAGKGQYVTIYANADHVFFECHPDGYSDMQGNTVSPPVNMRGFAFFPWNTAGCGSDGGPNPGSAFNPVHYPGT